jgi:hypothetical protein
MAINVDKDKIQNFQQIIKQVGGDELLGREEKEYRSEYTGIKPSINPGESVVNSQAFELAYQARAALETHVSTPAEYIRNGQSWLMEHKHSFEPYIQKLRDLRLPDTKVNLKGKKFEIPWDVIDYANKVPQEAAVSLLHDITGLPALEQLYKYSRLSGQEDKPTLWLVQKLYCECEANAQVVNTLHQDAATREAMAAIPTTQQEVASAAVKEIFGPIMYDSLLSIARINQTSVYAIFAVVFHKIMQDEERARTSKPVTSLWDNFLKQKTTA